jgi:hypothetical protein
MRLATIADKERVETICNDPVIRLWTAFEGAPACDATRYLTAPSFAVIGESGCFLAHHLDTTRYVIHTNLLPECRGAKAVEASKEALALAFLKTDATELMTMVPATIPHARLLARQMGFRVLFNRQAVWPALGELHAMGFYSLSLDDWILSDHCAAAGSAFHERLHGELGLKAHRHDQAHDAYVGAAVEMIKAGNVSKAIATYNRWARFALYQPVEIVSTEPLRIDIKQCVLRIEGDQFFMEAPHHA